MLFLYGSQNFGYNTPSSDKDWIEYVYPTKEDLILQNFVAYEYSKNEGKLYVRDIRYIYKEILKQNINGIQFLFAQECEDIEDLQWFFERRQELIRCNPIAAYNSNAGYIYSCLNSGTAKGNVRAIATLRYMEKLLKSDEVVLRDPSLAVLREDMNSLDKEVATIDARLEKVKPIFFEMPKNVQLIEDMKQEIIRLVFDNFNRNDVKRW